MALLAVNADGSYETKCAICDRPLSDPIFATTAFISDPTDRLWPYSDAGMHWECYAKWKYQKRFAALYFDSVQQWISTNPYWGIVAQTDAFILSANPNLNEPTADIDLRAIGPGFRVPILEWTDWINGGWDARCVHDLQRTAMLDIEARVRKIVSNSETLLRLSHRALEGKS
ncbi:MAG: hypothetical protein V4719_30140 [Planctomycetota bacterium]